MSKGSYLKKYLAKEGAIAGPRRRFTIDDSLKKSFLEGQIILIDKPIHWTSFDVIKKVRGALQIKKVGHAGTLDPLASGLLIICTGKFTKQIQYLMKGEKTYLATFTLGAVTPTYDKESDPEQFKPYEHITEEDVNQIAEQFRGEIMQKPPVYSAIKKQGTSAYTLARRGEDVDLEPRPIVISAFEILNIQLPEIEVKITCSTGTYIRSIAHDFGAALGCGAYLSVLRRTQIGEYKVEDAMEPIAFLDSLEAKSTDQNG